MKKEWKQKNLGEILTIERGGSPRPIDSFITESPDGVNWIKIGDTKGVEKYITETKEKIRPEGVKRSRMVYEGDFILSNSMSFGRPYILKTTGCIHDGWLVLRPKENNIDPDFLYHLLGSPLVFTQFDSLAAGSTVRNLNIDLVKTVKIPFPPISEQKRIVAVLDEAFAAISKAKKNVERNLANARELFEGYIQSIFAKAGPGWEKKSIGELCDLSTGGTPSRTRPEHYSGGKIRWLVSGDVNKGEIYDCDGRITESGLEDSNARYLPINSILIALNGQGKTRGTVAMLRTEATCNQSLVSISPKNNKVIISEYIFHNLKARYQEIRKITGDSGNDRRGLNMPLIRSISISFPKSISLQKDLVTTFSNITSESTELVAIYQKKLSVLEELKKSILQKAFSGELVGANS